jgi:hypothetical protein
MLRQGPEASRRSTRAMPAPDVRTSCCVTRLPPAPRALLPRRSEPPQSRPLSVPDAAHGQARAIDATGATRGIGHRGMRDRRGSRTPDRSRSAIAAAVLGATPRSLEPARRVGERRGERTRVVVREVGQLSPLDASSGRLEPVHVVAHGSDG